MAGWKKRWEVYGRGGAGQKPTRGRAACRRPLAQRPLALVVADLILLCVCPLHPSTCSLARAQVSAAHERRHLDAAVAAFAQAGRELGVLGA